METKSSLSELNDPRHTVALLEVIPSILGWLGRLGTRAIATLVVIGIAFPWIGQLLKPFVTEAVFILLCTAFMQVNIKAARSCLQRPGLVIAATLWTSIAIPILLGSVCLLLGLHTRAPELHVALMLQAMASPIMSAPAMAMIMGLESTLVLVTLVLSTSLIPLTAPLFAFIFVGPTLAIPPTALAANLFQILFGAALLGLVLRKLIGISAIERHGDKINGFNILILFVFVAAIMESVGIRILTDTATTIAYTALAFFICFIVLGVSYCVFLPAGKERAFSVSLMVSQRNMGLMLAATGGVLPDLAWLYFAVAQFPIFLTPQLLQPLVRRIKRKTQD